MRSWDASRTRANALRTRSRFRSASASASPTTDPVSVVPPRWDYTNRLERSRPGGEEPAHLPEPAAGGVRDGDEEIARKLGPEPPDALGGRERVGFGRDDDINGSGQGVGADLPVEPWDLKAREAPGLRGVQEVKDDVGLLKARERERHRPAHVGALGNVLAKRRGVDEAKPGPPVAVADRERGERGRGLAAGMKADRRPRPRDEIRLRAQEGRQRLYKAGLPNPGATDDHGVPHLGVRVEV